MIENAIAEGLINSDYRIRMHAIHLLIDHGHAEAIHLLLPLLRDREMPVRCAAIVALGTLADRQAFGPLVACLAASVSLERRNAVHALVALGDPHNRDAFLDALKTERNLFVRVVLIKAVSLYPDEEVLETLVELLTDCDGDVRAVAATALGKTGLLRAIPALQQIALTDTNAETSIYELYQQNSSVAKRAIQMLLHPEQVHDIGWPDIVDL